MSDVAKFIGLNGSDQWNTFSPLPADAPAEVEVVPYNLSLGAYLDDGSFGWGQSVKSIYGKKVAVPYDYEIVPHGNTTEKRQALYMSLTETTGVQGNGGSGQDFMIRGFLIYAPLANGITGAADVDVSNGHLLGSFDGNSDKGHNQVAFMGFDIPSEQMRFNINVPSEEGEKLENYGPAAAVYNVDPGASVQDLLVAIVDPEKITPQSSALNGTLNTARIYEMQFSVLRMEFIPDTSGDGSADLVILATWRSQSDQSLLAILHLNVFQPPKNVGFRFFSGPENTIFSILMLLGAALLVLTLAFSKPLIRALKSNYDQWRAMTIAAFVLMGSIIALNIAYNVLMATELGVGIGHNDPRFNTFMETRLYILVGVVVILGLSPVIMLAIPAGASFAAKRIYLPVHKMVKKSNDKRQTQIFTVKQPHDATRLQVVARVMLCVFIPLSIGLYFFNYLGPVLIPGFEELTTTSTIYDPAFSTNIKALFFTMILPAVGSFFLVGWIVTGGWLLDDTGVVYWVKNLKKREPLDINKVSSFISSFLGSVLGFTAIINYAEFLLDYPVLTIIYDSFNNIYLALVFAVIFFGLPVFTGFISGLLIVVRYENQYRVERKQLIHYMATIGLNRKFDIEFSGDEGLNTTIKLRLLPSGEEIAANTFETKAPSTSYAEPAVVPPADGDGASREEFEQPTPPTEFRESGDDDEL
ncbi:MAG: hypothetical protein ACTSU5_07575 [Promethearchaeota archaeon]